MDCIDHFIKSSGKEGAEPIWKLGKFLELFERYQFRNGRIKANQIRYSEAFVVKLISTKEEEN